MPPRVRSSSPLPAKPKIDCILDSGAYSAFRLGKPIIIDEYCDFLLANQGWMGHYVNLDVINPKDPERAAADSFANLLHMHKRGLRPVPVYHAGEDISWLYKMLDLGCEYIGLAASAMASRNKVNDWYSLAWDHLVTPSGKPIVKVHAFGEGRLGSMQKFPWYSADSTSWLYDAQRNGAMTMPGGAKVVQRNDARHTPQAQDLHGMQGEDQNAFDDMLDRLGVDPAGFGERGSRTGVILRTYISLMDCLQKQDAVRAGQPVRHMPPGFFGQSKHHEDQAEPPTPFKFHLVIGGNYCAASVLAYAGYENALASYYYIKSMSFYNKLSQFCMEPQALCASTDPFKESYAVLSKYVRVPVRAAA